MAMSEHEMESLHCDTIEKINNGVVVKSSQWYSVQTAMLSSKACYFFQNAKDSTLNTYIILFLTGLGLTPEQAGRINGLRFIGFITVAPLWGILADFKQIHRYVILILCIGSFISMSSLPFVSIPMNPQRVCDIKKNSTSNQSYIDLYNTITQPVTPSNTERVPSNLSLRHITKQNNVTSYNRPTKSYIAYGEMGTISNNVLQDIDNRADKKTLYIVMMSLNLLATCFDGATAGFVDSGVIQKISKIESIESAKKIDFGQQRLFGAIGFGLGSFMASISVEYLAMSQLPCYTSVFMIYGILVLSLTVSTMLLFHKLSFISDRTHQESSALNGNKKENVEVAKELRETLGRCDILFFFATTFVLGVFHNMLIGFLFILLKEINCPNIVMGLSIAAGSMSSVIGFRFCEKVIKLLRGTINVLTIACFSWAVRFLWFSYMYNPWLVLLIMFIFQGIGFGLFVATSVIHVKTISPPAIHTSMYGIFNGLFYGAGAMVSNIVGGIIVMNFGVRNLFFFASILGFIWTFIMVIYSLIQACCCNKA